MSTAIEVLVETATGTLPARSSISTATAPRISARPGDRSTQAET